MKDAGSEQDRLRLALDSARMGTWDWQVAESRMLWDERMHILFGYMRGAFDGKFDTFISLLFPEDRQRVREQMHGALERKSEYDGEMRIVRPDQAIRVMRVRFRVPSDLAQAGGSIVGVAWDITEKRRTEQDLERERNLFATLMENLPDHIYFKDRESRFVAVNPAMARWMSTLPTSIIGKTDADFFTPEHAQRALQDECRILESGRPIINNEEKETWPDRDDTWVSTTKMPWRDADGHIIGTFGLSRDITERKLADERLQRLAAELRAKNEALQEDLEMARELQSAMLPQRFPHFPHSASEQDSAVQFYHYFQPSRTVSGDFFDVFDISDDKAGIFICDVMGHGVRAALVAATIRTLLTELKSLWEDPGALLMQLNQSLINALRKGDITLFASAFCVVADLGKGEMRYANAGHPYPLRVTHEQSNPGGRSAPLSDLRPGPALGLIHEAKYETQHCELSPRDVVLLFTDGLFEVEGSEGRLYDYKQLSSAVKDRCRLPTEELCHSLIADVQQFSANRQFNDDVCLVAMDIDRVRRS